VRSAEIGPSSFYKIRLLGKGDVGKVYLVREKKTEKLFAMKVLSKKEMIKRNKIKRALAEQVSGAFYLTCRFLYLLILLLIRKYWRVQTIRSSSLFIIRSSLTTTYIFVSLPLCDYLSSAIC
jgi:serine/threonine protein kinase